MTVAVETPAAAPEAAAGLNPAETAAVAVGQRGLSEPTGVNELPAAGPERPAWCPEKFFKDGQVDTEGLAKSYAELEKTRSAPKVEEEVLPAAEIAPDGKIEKKVEEAKAAAETPAAQSAIEAAAAEYAKDRVVTDDTIKALADAGIPREVFDLYMAGVQAQEAALVTEIHGYTGSAEEYTAMATWAANNLSQDDLDAFNASLDNPALRENSVRGLYTRYQTARPSEGTMITPAGTPSSAGDVYSDRSQLLADQKDARYQTDPAFRQSVSDKLLRSQKNGFQMVARQTFERNIVST